MRAIIKNLIFLLVGLLSYTTTLSAQVEPIRVLRTGTSFDYRDYGNGAIPELVAADNAFRSGNWEQAIMTYDNIVAQWPAWAPVYVKRAMTKYRMGRITEAEADLNTARRLSLNSVRLFTENSPSGRLGLLTNSPARLDTMADVDVLEEVNAFKRSGQFVQAVASLDQFHDAGRISNTHYALLRGNMELLLNDYDDAIAFYDYALQAESDPNILHNRGLARILNFNYVDGCQDLLNASNQGYAEALDQWTDLCNW